MLSSADHGDDIKRCKTLDVSAYVIKPVSQMDLFSAIGRALGERTVAKEKTAPRSLPTAARPLHVLLAEDNRVNQRLATLLLERVGHSVVLVETGVAAIEAFKREKFELILMDLQMPEMGGIEATAEIRSLEAADGRHTPIIALTAHAMQGDRERCERASMDGYVSKPIHRDELFAEIDRLLESAAPKLSYVGDAEFLAKLAGMFLADYPQQIQEMRNALAQRNAARLVRAARVFKEAVAILCGEPLTSLAAELEAAGERGTLGEAERLLAQIDAGLDQLRPALESASVG